MTLSFQEHREWKEKQVDRNKYFNRFVYKRKKMKTVKEDLSEELNHSTREKRSKRTFQDEQNGTSNSLLLSIEVLVRVLLTLPPWVLINLS